MTPEQMCALADKRWMAIAHEREVATALRAAAAPQDDRDE